MAGYNRNKYQYETSPRKLKPEYEPIKKQYPKKSAAKKTSQKTKIKKKSSPRIVFYIGIIFVLLFAVSYRNALVAQKYSELKDLRSQLSETEKENKQLEVSIESKTNLGSIEKKASDELGLKKLDDSKTVYVSLDKQDYVEPSTEDLNVQDNENFLEKIINKIKLYIEK